MKKVKLVVTLAALATLLTLAYTSFAQSTEANTNAAENWVLVGSHVVDYTLDRDVVDLEESPDTYTSLRFKVVNGPINLHKCTIHFEDGENQDVTFSTNPSEASANQSDGRRIDLHGNTRKIEKVTFWYDTKNSSDKKAVVEVWGKK